MTVQDSLSADNKNIFIFHFFLTENFHFFLKEYCGQYSILM